MRCEDNLTKNKKKNKMESLFENRNQINFIPCLKWVKKGVAKTSPTQVQLTKDEIAQVLNEARKNLVENRRLTEGQSSNQMDEYGFDNYDDEDDSAANALGISSLAQNDSGNLDENFIEIDDDSENEDDLIMTSDNLILACRIEGYNSVLEVYVYNEEERSLYVHHDFNIPSFPLCVEWLDYEPDMPKGNYCAIGTMDPIIQIWDLDIINCVEPTFTLGRLARPRKNIERIGHTDAVLSLAWNKKYHHIMASGSADNTIMLWDIDIKKPSNIINAFKDKVQCLEWHHLEGETLLAGGCDKLIKLFDCRSPNLHQTWNLNGEPEKAIWNPLNPHQFLAGTDAGIVQLFDCRKGQLWSLNAHNKEITGLVVSKLCPGLMLTSSTDQKIKIWDVKENGAELVNETDFNLGLVHCLDICPELPFVFAAGGDNKNDNFKVYDIQNISGVRDRFQSRQMIQITSSNEEILNQ